MKKQTAVEWLTDQLGIDGGTMRDKALEMEHNGIGLNAVGVHTELNGTSGSMLSQMLKGTPCLLRFSPCYKSGFWLNLNGRVTVNSVNRSQLE